MPVSYRFGQQSGISGKASYEEKCYYDYAAFHCLRRLNINLLTKMGSGYAAGNSKHCYHECLEDYRARL